MMRAHAMLLQPPPGGGGRSVAPRAFRWTPRRVGELCDLIADGFTFKDAGVILRAPPEECRARFAEIRAAFGAQAA